MQLLLNLLLLIVALRAPQAWSQYDSDVLSRAHDFEKSIHCSDLRKDCQPSSVPQTIRQSFELASQNCEIEQKALNCSEVAKRDPELKEKIRKCTPEMMCNESQKQAGLLLKGCFWNAPGTWGSGVWKEVSEAASKIQTTAKECLGNKECLKNAATTAMNPGNPALYLWRLQNYFIQTTDLKISPEAATAIYEASQKWYEEKKIQVQCFDRQSQSELFCYYALQALAPTAAVKAAQQMPKIVKLLKLGSSKANVAGDARASRAVVESRRGEAAGISSEVQKLSQVPMPGTSDGLKVFTNKAANGEKFMTYEYNLEVPGKGLRRKVSELPLDPLTGAVDANLPSGKKFLELMLKENQGKSTLAFLDVGNLGFVNREFQAGRVAGDAYLKKVAEAIQTAGKGKINLVKLGGDEFGILVHEADPVKAQKILQEISDQIYSKDVHQVFRDEKIARAKAFKENPAADADKFKKEFVPYSRESASIGSTEIGANDTLESTLSRAESQATEMKIQAKVKMNQDASKYGGPTPDPKGKTDQRFKPEIQRPMTAPTSSGSTAKLPKLSDDVPVLSESRSREIGRFRQFSLAEYVDETGSTNYRMEKYFNNESGQRKVVTSEVAINSKTGFIDANTSQGQDILAAVAKERKTGIVWAEVQDLGKVNYFAKGTKAGDELLEETAKAMKSVLRKENIGFKLKGSEFVLEVDHLDAASLKGVQQRLQEAVRNSPGTQKIFQEQRDFLLNELKRNPNSIELKAQFDNLSKMKPSITTEATVPKPGETIADLLSRTQGLHKATSP